MNLSNYLKDIIKELRLTTFPTQNVVVNFTIFVVLFTAAMAAFLGVLDVFFGAGTIKAINLLKESDAVMKLHATTQPTIEATTTIINATTTK